MRGGYRPGGGRPKGSKDKKPRKRKDPKPVAKEKNPRKPRDKPAPAPVEMDLRERIQKLLEAGVNVKAKAFRDLANKLANGQSLTATEMKNMATLEKGLADTVKEVPPDIQSEAEAEGMTPLDYMLKVMRDPTEDKEMRARMAIEAAKYCHMRVDTMIGKKQDRDERARTAGSGKFAPSAPPLKRVK